MAERPRGIERYGPWEERPTPAEVSDLEERALSGDEVAAARIEVEESRAWLTETSDALQERLQPENLKRETRAQANEAARSAGYKLLDTIKRNPGPAAVAGIVLARRSPGSFCGGPAAPSFGH